MNGFGPDSDWLRNDSDWLRNIEANSSRFWITGATASVVSRISGRIIDWPAKAIVITAEFGV